MARELPVLCSLSTMNSNNCFQAFEPFKGRPMSIYRRLLLQLTVLTIALSLPTLVCAQDVASLTGTITDTSGAVIVGADVVLVNTTTNETYRATTNSLGSYTISNVPPGPGYKITFSAQGFASVDVVNVYLNVANTRTQDARLHPGNVDVSVEVSASSQNVTIDTTDATI